MSCKHCDEVADKGDIAYVRVQAANVGIIGCDEHAGWVIRAVNAMQSAEQTMSVKRVVLRVKGDV